MNNLIRLFFPVLFVLTGNCFAQKIDERNSADLSVNPASSGVPLNCAQTNSIAELSINNVRTTMQVGGDMWWDLNNPKYEVPKGSGKHSLFAGALWIGGIDNGGQLKVAAQTYRQTGIDYWAGPINTMTGDIDPVTCQSYDTHWKVTRDQVADFIDNYGNNSYIVPQVIRSWPGNGDPAKFEAQFLAPFEDINGDGIYDWTDGDYPKFNFSPDQKSNCNDYLFGDELIWWVFNDVGNVHTETNSPFPIGLEIRTQAFAYQTNDELNNMTFYKYEVINRSFDQINDMWFGQWVDFDLGNASDDYVGCDVGRGMGYGYNGDEDDETISGYGFNPPAIGIDFLQGPLADANDGIDNDRDSIIDEAGEQIIMTKFMYYNGGNSLPTGNPNGYHDFYNYLKGLWLDGQQLTYGDDGRNPNAPPCSFMFPGDTDPEFPLTPWTEATAGNVPADRRFLQSVGPFTMQPGAVKHITVGAIWARTSSGGALGSVEELKEADDKAQALFDNCFILIDGPPAPEMAIIEDENSLELQLINTDSIELFDVVDPTISKAFYSDNRFRFEGYRIFQLANADVELNYYTAKDPDLAREVAQVDVQNGVKRIINYDFDKTSGTTIPYVAVEGKDEGISHSFRITKDFFSQNNQSLINHRTYYYAVISYAYNNYKTYNANDPAALDGQKRSYLPGRENVKTYAAIPHKFLSGDKSEVLNEIRAVPNPYYAFSEYETDVNEGKIKITNLPPKCTIRIYTMAGTFVEEITRNDASNDHYGSDTGNESDSSVDWNLKNYNDIPISSGLYLFHIVAPGIGEKVLKWYGIMRPVSIDGY